MKEESAKHDTVRMAPSYRPHTIGGFARSYRFALSSVLCSYRLVPPARCVLSHHSHRCL